MSEARNTETVVAHSVIDGTRIAILTGVSARRSTMGGARYWRVVKGLADEATVITWDTCWTEAAARKSANKCWLRAAGREAMVGYGGPAL